MSKNELQKRFGIRVTMPSDDTMSAPHLLGDNWSSVRWFDTEQTRDHALAEMQDQPPYYRRGDSPSVTLEKIEE